MYLLEKLVNLFGMLIIKISIYQDTTNPIKKF